MSVKDNIWLRKNIASSFLTSSNILKKMAINPYEKWQILKLIAKNANTPVKVLEHMSKDARKSIRDNAISNLSSHSITIN